MNHNAFQRCGLSIVAFHFLISLVHGVAHSRLQIDMNLWQSVYILLVITLLPLVSGVLIWRRGRGGFLLLAGAMMGSLVFGVYYHFIAVGADNVATLGLHPWAAPFQLTAALLAILESVGVLTGIFGGLRKQ